MKRFRTFISESDDVRTPSAKSLAKKHGVSLKTIKNQEEIGAKIEKEHTKSTSKAKETARDHINEFPGYYPALKKMEKKLEKEK